MSNKSQRGQPVPVGPNWPAIVAAVAVIGVLAALGLVLFQNNPAPTAAVPTSQSAAAPAAEAPTAVPAPTTAPAGAANAPAASGKQYAAPEDMKIDPAKQYTATITTPRGDIVVRLRPDIAPKSVNSFAFLAREGFYNGTTWHRVIQGFMAQGGDPTGTGTGGPGYSVPAEFSANISFDKPGYLAMARAQDPDSAGSQFFITTAAAPHLDGQYTIFGEVIQGQEIANAIPLRDPMSATTPGEQIVKVTVTEG